jgi:hypothetical protein
VPEAEKIARHSLIWQQVEGLSKIDRDTLYSSAPREVQQAMEACPPLVIRTASGAVVVQPCVSAETIAAGQVAALARDYPGDAAVLEDIRQQTDFTKTAAAVATNAILQACPEARAQAESFQYARPTMTLA